MKLRPTLGALRSPSEVEGALEGLVRANVAQMKARRVPVLYQSRVRYRPERSERWRTAAEVASSGYGDCEDLAAYRAAELRRQGVPAVVRIKQTGRKRWHAIVESPRGTEDPSRRLLPPSRRRRARRPGRGLLGSPSSALQVARQGGRVWVRAALRPGARAPSVVVRCSGARSGERALAHLARRRDLSPAAHRLLTAWSMAQADPTIAAGAVEHGGRLGRLVRWSAT